MQNPFNLFTPLQKAILYRALLTAKNQLQATAQALSSYPAEFDEQNVMLGVTGFQLEQMKGLLTLMENEINVDELAIMPHFQMHIMHDENL